MDLDGPVDNPLAHSRNHDLDHCNLVHSRPGSFAVNPVSCSKCKQACLFNFTPAGMSYTADAEFPQLISEERPEPLDAANVSVAHPAANNIGDDYRYNTIAPATNPQGGINDSTTTMPGGVFSIWQPHFDRDFTSVIELFHLPIIGPRLLTQRLERMRHSPPQQASEDVTVVDIPGNPDLISSAVGMFLQPDVLPVGNDVNDNAWYRLLQFVEVPSKVNAMLGEYLSRHRVDGQSKAPFHKLDGV